MENVCRKALWFGLGCLSLVKPSLKITAPVTRLRLARGRLACLRGRGGNEHATIRGPAFMGLRSGPRQFLRQSRAGGAQIAQHG